MSNYYSEKTEEGIRILFMQYDAMKMKKGMQLLKEAAEEGEPDAYCFLAMIYMEGSHVWRKAGIERNEEKYKALLCEGAAKDSACAILTLLQLPELSGEAEKLVAAADLKSAYEDVMRKAEGDHSLCQFIMGMCFYCGGYFRANGLNPRELYESGEEAEEDMREKASMWYEKALYGGITLSLAYLIDLFDGEDEIQEEEEKLQELIQFAAKNGDPMWQNKLADLLYEEDNYTESLEWYEKAAANGETDAWYDAGYQYERGLGISVNLIKAINAYEAGAKAGNAGCQTRLGKHLLWGKAVNKDEEQAYQWFSKATMQGDEIAKMFKGHCLLFGLGVEKDEDKATDYLSDALNFNYPEEGESQDMAEQSNFDWNEDMLQLFWDLGNVNEYGLGVDENQNSAGYYYYMVARDGWPEAKEKMTHYKKNLFGKWKRIK